MQYVPYVLAVISRIAPAVLAYLIFRWLRPALTPAYAVRFIETDGVPSARQGLGVVVCVFTLAMVASDRINIEVIRLLLEAVFGLFLVGGAAKVGTAFAARPPDIPAITAITTKNAAVGDGAMIADEPPPPPTA